MSTDTSKASMGPIACVTVTTPDLDEVESLYTQYLEYRLCGEGRLSAALAELWQAPAMADRPYRLLGPAAGDECIFRFVQADADPGYVPFSTWGWNAAEIMVENVDALAERLAGSSFSVVGEPQNLSFSDDIRAMQVLGPGNELLYLTEFKKQLPGFDTPIARCPVDSVFIVILGGPSMDGLQQYLGARFGVPGAAPVESRVKGMSAAFGLSPEHRYPIAALPLSGQNMIEVDEMPAKARARPVKDGCLPAGISIVSFFGRGIDVHSSIPAAFNEPPYRNADTVSCHVGTAGELIEILHT